MTIKELEMPFITKRESKILQMISMGFSTNDIASYFNISPEAVKSHRKSLRLKLRTHHMAPVSKKEFEMDLV
jgi:DNA-binding CsgD family transcriptional regulator